MTAGPSSRPTGAMALPHAAIDPSPQRSILSSRRRPSICLGPTRSSPTSPARRAPTPAPASTAGGGVQDRRATTGHVVTVGSLARLDGHGTFTRCLWHCGLLPEYDTGTEPLQKLFDQLNGYATLRRAPAVADAVLATQPAREHNIHRRLSSASVVTVTAAAQDLAQLIRPTPADAMWLVHGERVVAPSSLISPVATFRRTRSGDAAASLHYFRHSNLRAGPSAGGEIGRVLEATWRGSSR
jgi:hypothetical protein